MYKHNKSPKLYIIFYTLYYILNDETFIILFIFNVRIILIQL